MTMYGTEQEIDNTMSQWMLTKRFTADPKTNALIRQRVEEYLELGGYVAQAHFEKAYLSLLDEEVIQPFRGSIASQPSAAPEIPPEIVSWIESPRTSTSDLRHRYNSDPIFRKQYDAYEKTKVGQTQVTLSVEEYRKLPAAVVAQNYRRDHPQGFRVAVDKLISAGLI